MQRKFGGCLATSATLQLCCGSSLTCALLLAGRQDVAFELALVALIPRDSRGALASTVLRVARPVIPALARCKANTEASCFLFLKN